MKKELSIISLISAIILSLMAIRADTLDYPHSYINNISCNSCHFVYGDEPSLLPEWTATEPQDIDDTQYNTLCWGCHNDIKAPYQRTHSSLQINASYGDWSVECRVCHHPHRQEQIREYGDASYLSSGISTSIEIDQPVPGQSQIYKEDAGWTDDTYQGLVVIPNTVSSKLKYGYKILSNTSDTLTVQGRIDLSEVTPGVDTFAIIYGKLIRDKITLDFIHTYTSVSTDIPDEYTLVEEGAGWAENQYQGLVVVPDIAKPYHKCTILGNTSDTLTLSEPMDLSKVEVGDVFMIIELKTGDKTVKFFNSTGPKSFADGDVTYDGVCEVCHTETTHFRNDGTGDDPLHLNVGTPAGEDCIRCHSHINGFGHGGSGGGGGDGTGCSGAAGCHQDQDSHPSHLGLEGVVCLTCHLEDNFPTFADSKDLADTTICDSCHSVDGVPIVKDTDKDYWENPGSSSGAEGSWAEVEGYSSFCGSCHDITPGNTKVDGTGDDAVNIMGDDSTYGFFVTGHGKASGNYADLSWQAASADGNPAANQQCSACHDLSTQHYNNETDRLKAGYENDADNSNCKQCHSPGTVATGAPEWYTTYSDYENSAHSVKKCSECHDVHGAIGAYAGMTKKSQESLCYNCHKDPASGGIENLAVSGSAYANDILEAFSMTGSKHDLGTAFTIGPEIYTLECISCHNVHVVTGKYWDADQNKSPVTLFSNNTAVWGDDSTEKMDYYADTGKYTKPGGSTHVFDGYELPDYATFCLECHSNAIGSIKAKDWVNNPHGKKSAGYTGLGTYGTAWGPYSCPNGYNICGRATGWSGSTVSQESYAWPVIPKGRGYSAFVKGGYDQAERNAGLNYILSCTDCHEAHGSDKYSLMRRSLNAKYDGTELILSSDKGQWHSPFAGGNPEGLCWSCHGGYQLTKEHFQWHYQKGYCSA
jgi:predicted CXXCH cytochrome family protein